MKTPDLTRLKLDYAPYSPLQQRQILNRIRRSKDVFIDRKWQASAIQALEELLAASEVSDKTL